MNVVAVAFVTLTLLQTFAELNCSSVEEKLTIDLLTSYNKHARPARNNSQPVTVEIDIGLPQIMKVEEKNEIIQTNVWIRQFWNDSRLTWNKTKYNSVEQLILNTDALWVPDISLLNNVEGSVDVQGGDVRLVVTNEGKVAWLNPAIFVSSCEMDITYFPLDDQVCRLEFGSWSHSVDFIDVRPLRETADLSVYVENGEWVLLGVKAERFVNVYKSIDGEFPNVTYFISIRRRTMFYMMNFVLPCLLIAVLTLLVFLLPPESGERMSFGVTVLLSFTILIMMLQAKLPPTSKQIPLIAVYYACTIIEVSAAMYMGCIMMRFYYPEDSSAPIPDWVRVFIMNYGSRLVWLGHAVNRVTQQVVVQDLRQMTVRDTSGKEPTNMKILTDNIFKKEEADVKMEEWRLVAIIINRMFVWLYMFTVLLTLVAVFLKSPRISSGQL